jgi:hypothetical protein
MVFKSENRIASFGFVTAIFASAMAISSVASAATIVCPNPLLTGQTNTYQTTSAADCVWGDGNIGQGGGNDEFLAGGATNDAVYGNSGPTFNLAPYNLGGWTLIESSQNAAGMSTMTSLTLTGITTTHFAWTLNDTTYVNYALGLKDGASPKYGVFLLTGRSGVADMTGGSWSHVVLYGTQQGEPQTPPPSVPEPAMLSLIGLGLIGLAATRRRRNV